MSQMDARPRPGGQCAEGASHIHQGQQVEQVVQKENEPGQDAPPGQPAGA